MRTCDRNRWPPRLVTVPGLHGSENAHWQSWLERQFARSLRVEQSDWEAPNLGGWARTVGEVLAKERGPFVIAAHSYGCLAAAHAIALARHAGAADVAGILFVAPASPEKFESVGKFAAHRIDVPSILVGSESDPWMPAGEARELARRFGSAFVNLGAAGHINTAAGFGPWPRAKLFIDTLVHCAARSVFGSVDGPDLVPSGRSKSDHLLA
ncbi:RBBP9/YdeN family alpha/beta hydrolase [Trinickia dinghuensis]|uniref:Alpha/beta hydrolase n=1 Tax=Trinickia dinghuensis TaxID=2291023 RepID=A0A3D8JRM3_9BURK|nr:alpha/beta hydrolase [Trinickia dinghuensis]RDU95773.1 alpha/beta hydrolase [Trinickia dinghuensis]